MKILTRYLVGQNLFLLSMCLGIGMGIYLITDLFDRIDDFVESGLGLGITVWYFVAKLPLILSQILPAVFLIAMVIQLGVMTRSREMTALNSGGVRPVQIYKPIVVYAIMLCLFQLFFSQMLGVWGLRESAAIWRDQVRKHSYSKDTVRDIWFKQKDMVVEVGLAAPGEKTAQGIKIFVFGPKDESLVRIISAEKAAISKDRWTLENGTAVESGSFATNSFKKLVMPIRQDLKDYLAVNRSDDPGKLPVWKLGQVIENLRKSGSNVERLKTIFHGKFSYSFSILTMALVALALYTFSGNIYLNIGLSLGLTFLFYAAHVLGGALGENGVVPPIIGAWFGNILFSTLAFMRLAWTVLPSSKSK